MKSGIRKKLLLLIGLLSLALIIASVLISSKLYSDSLERNVASQCAETSDSLCSSIHSEHIDFIRDYAAKVRAVYDENREELEEASEREFKSFEEREEYYSRFTEGIFPPRSGLGMSYEMLVFMHEYSLMLDRMDMLSFAGGMDSASVFYYDSEHGNLVCMIDRMPEGSTRYSFPVSVKKPADERLKASLDKGAAETFFNETECFSLAPVSDAENEVFVLFSKQTGDLPHSVRLFSFYSFIITLGATLIIGAVVLLFADRLIVKNVKKLTAASEKFTSEIHGGYPEKVSADIRSKDEIGELSEKFDIMQDSILGYVSSLAEKTAKEEKMNAELGLAARIQSESLPKGGLKAGAAELCSFLKPAREVGGDLYDYFMLDDRRMFFCLADVSGKGIPASLFMMRAKELIKANVPTSATLGEFAFKLNNELCRGNEESIFITAFFGVLDTVSGKLDYLRAGHEEPFLKRGGEVKQIGEESNTILGVFEDAEFTADETELCPGDVLLMFTDGLNEGINEAKEAFGYGRIAEALSAACGDVTGVLYGALCEFCGEAEQFDDVTMLALSFGKAFCMELDAPDYGDITAVTDAVLERLSGFDSDRVSEVGLIIDEVMNNEISYAFEHTAQPRISVRLETADGEAKLVFEDNGIAFDPLSDVTSDDIDSSEGGFGIALVRALSDSQSYERDGGVNRLTVRKNMRA